MAIVAPQEEASSDDVLIWKYAASRAHQAAEAARARAREAADDSTQRRGLRALGPALERAVRGVRFSRTTESRQPARAVIESWPDPLPVAVPEPWHAPSLTEIWTAPVAETPVELPAYERLWTPEVRVVTLDDVVAGSASVPLPAALLLYDDVLEWLQRLHASGLTHGAVDTSSVIIEPEGRCTLRDSGLLAPPARSPVADLQAATAVFVDTIRGTVFAESLPLPARCLVEQTMAVESASNRLTAARLRADLATAAGAFLQDDWEIGARAWLSHASVAISGVELTGFPVPVAVALADARAVAPEPSDDKRPLLYGGVTKREPRFMIGLGIAASASITLVVGAAVGLTGSRTPAAPPAQHHQAGISAPALPSAVPTAAAATPAALLPTPSAAPPSAVPAPPPPPPPVQAHAAPSSGPVVFTPVAVPAPPPTPIPSIAASPTPGCLLGIICG
ncbi:MAG TPA: hypothetical protein VF155_01670 [Candidatus Dormibacteraeota bacterium]